MWVGRFLALESLASYQLLLMSAPWHGTTPDLHNPLGLAEVHWLLALWAKLLEFFILQTPIDHVKVPASICVMPSAIRFSTTKLKGNSRHRKRDHASPVLIASDSARC